MEVEKGYRRDTCDEKTEQNKNFKNNRINKLKGFIHTHIHIYMKEFTQCLLAKTVCWEKIELCKLAPAVLIICKHI